MSSLSLPVSSVSVSVSVPASVLSLLDAANLTLASLVANKRKVSAVKGNGNENGNVNANVNHVIDANVNHENFEKELEFRSLMPYSMQAQAALHAFNEQSQLSHSAESASMSSSVFPPLSLPPIIRSTCSAFYDIFMKEEPILVALKENSTNHDVDVTGVNYSLAALSSAIQAFVLKTTVDATRYPTSLVIVQKNKKNKNSSDNNNDNQDDDADCEVVGLLLTTKMEKPNPNPIYDSESPMTPIFILLDSLERTHLFPSSSSSPSASSSPSSSASSSFSSSSGLCSLCLFILGVSGAYQGCGLAQLLVSLCQQISTMSRQTPLRIMDELALEVNAAETSNASDTINSDTADSDTGSNNLLSVAEIVTQATSSSQFVFGKRAFSVETEVAYDQFKVEARYDATSRIKHVQPAPSGPDTGTCTVEWRPFATITSPQTVKQMVWRT